MNLRQLEVFHAVMRAGTVTGAARLLGVTQPSVSTVLKHCEAQLRIPLFRRIGGRLQPTPEAEAILPDIEAIFARLDSVWAPAARPEGRQCRHAVAGRRLPHREWLPGGGGGVLHGGTARRACGAAGAVVVRVAGPRGAREVELGIGIEPIMHPEVETEVIVSSGVACVMRDDHPLARQEEVGIRQLDGLPIITFLPRAPLRGYVDRALSEAGIAPRIVAQVSMSMTGMALAYHGAGVALVEPFLLNTFPVPGAGRAAAAAGHRDEGGDDPRAVRAAVGGDGAFCGASAGEVRRLVGGEAGRCSTEAGEGVGLPCQRPTYYE